MRALGRYRVYGLLVEIKAPSSGASGCFGLGLWLHVGHLCGIKVPEVWWFRWWPMLSLSSLNSVKPQP